MSDALFRIVRRLDLRGDRTWRGIVVADLGFEAFLADLESEVSAQLGLKLRIVESGNLSVRELISQLAGPGDDGVALIGFDRWDQQRWQHLDIDRNALDRIGPILFCLTPGAADSLSRYAPNVRSYLGSLLVIGPDESGMTAEEVERRLAALRESYVLTDEQVITMAQSGSLPHGAHFVEWLILLDRGDLV